MPIIRNTYKFEGQFTQVPNSWLRDELLSLRAKGLLAQLMSHSDGWSVTIQGLASFNGCGRDAIRSAVRELEEAGYLTRRQDRSEGGEFSETIWDTSEPGTVIPVTDYPTTVNPLLKKTNEKKTKNKKTNLSYKYGDSILGEAFETFWGLYPRKVGKAAARTIFEKMAAEHLAEILDGVVALSKDPNLPATEFIPHPATWLGREGWEDEAYPKREVKLSERIAVTPGKRDWVNIMHDLDEHFECRPGEFGCKDPS